MPWSRITMKNTPFRLSLFLVSICSLLACQSDEAPKAGSLNYLNENTALLSQGWTQEIREAAWFTSFGSKLLPYNWFLHLEQAQSSALLRDDTFLRTFGLTPAPKSARNPDALPIGLTRLSQTEQQGDWIGLGCAACHSGQLRFRDLYLHIDGGASLLDYQAFERAVIEALDQTLQQPEKFKRLLARLAPSSENSLREQMQTQLTKLRERASLNQTSIQYGHGRLDAFGQIFNAVTAQYLGIPSNAREPNAPVSFPVLWDASHLDLVQWNASAPNAGPGPLIQNVTTALAVFGELDIHSPSNLGGYRSSAAFDNLGEIQEHWYTLTAPRWPEMVLGNIDPQSRIEGEKLYAQHCIACHELSDENDPKRQLHAVKTPLEQIGTDARMVENFLQSEADSGAFKGQKLFKFAGPEIGERAPSIQLVAHATIGALLEHPVEAVRAGIRSSHHVATSALDEHPNYYKARPLNGIWSSAPYLHNGSVPNLAELLSAPEKRVSRFSVGDIEFDAQNVGFPATVSTSPNTFVFDATVAGNRNTGHEYGTQLTQAEKNHLIEYLKSL